MLKVRYEVLLSLKSCLFINCFTKKGSSKLSYKFRNVTNYFTLLLQSSVVLCIVVFDTQLTMHVSIYSIYSIVYINLKCYSTKTHHSCSKCVFFHLLSLNLFTFMLAVIFPAAINAGKD